MIESLTIAKMAAIIFASPKQRYSGEEEALARASELNTVLLQKAMGEHLILAPIDNKRLFYEYQMLGEMAATIYAASSDMNNFETPVLQALNIRARTQDFKIEDGILKNNRY